MVYQTNLINAANNVLIKSLQLRKDQNLLIFTDHASLDVANLLAESAKRLDILTSIIFVPQLVQKQFGLNESLPLPMEAAIRDSDAVFSCLSDGAKHLAYRRRVLLTSWSRQSKVVHAPGMTLDILAMTDTDYDLVRTHCQAVATALVLGREAKIITRDSQGRQYRLSVDISGWDFTPGIADGVIQEGTWSNLPPGETYIFPLSGNGQVVVNGSIPGRVLAPNEELILTFEGGRLTRLQPKDSPAAEHLQSAEFAVARSQGDPNWDILAEVGFGVNPVVTQLTGAGLVDEKKAGTVHIALGDNSSLGGKIESTIHCDLIIERPTVLIDGKPLVQAGDLCNGEASWLPDPTTTAVPEAWWDSVTEVRRSGTRAEIKGDRLMRQWNCGPGRRDTISVGNETACRLTARLYQIVPEGGDRISRAALLGNALRAGLSSAQVPALLWILRQYDLVRLPGEQL